MLTFLKSKRDKYDRAIFSAAEYGDWETVFAFLDQSYPVNYPDPDTHRTLLDLADIQKNIRVINALQQEYGALDSKALLENAEISNITTKIRRTSLHDAPVSWLPPQPAAKPILNAPNRPSTNYHPVVDALSGQLNGITLRTTGIPPHIRHGQVKKAHRNCKR